jgi:hypothetical protein
MTIKEAKAIDMVSYLSMVGVEPAIIRGKNYWYQSPFRNETTPSFKVNRSRNQWYDFGEGKGGNLLDFIIRLENISIPDALKRLQQGGKLSTHNIANIAADAPGIEVLSVHMVSSFALIRYYLSRRIPDNIASQYLQEVRYKNGDKIYYALGFKNDAGGYELRSPYFKGSSRPKAPTWIKTNANNLAVFEGSFDFLSYLMIYQNQEAPTRDFLILNSTSFFEASLTKMQTYQHVHLYLDNNATGSKCTKMALEKSSVLFIDERGLYKGYDDLNHWLVNIGTVSKRQT